MKTLSDFKNLPRDGKIRLYRNAQTDLVVKDGRWYPFDLHTGGECIQKFSAEAYADYTNRELLNEIELCGEFRFIEEISDESKS